jgi:hypothetical protein
MSVEAIAGRLLQVSAAGKLVDATIDVADAEMARPVANSMRTKASQQMRHCTSGRQGLQDW